jgi:hypothetical protein
VNPRKCLDFSVKNGISRSPAERAQLTIKKPRKTFRRRASYFYSTAQMNSPLRRPRISGRLACDFYDIAVLAGFFAQELPTTCRAKAACARFSGNNCLDVP